METVILPSGVKLKPKLAFDTFWRYVTERKTIDDKRRANLPKPWSLDPVLSNYRFCNVFRVSDRCCQYLIRDIIEAPSESNDPQEVCFRVLLWNIFTKIETYQLLQRSLGSLRWSTYDRKAYISVLSNAAKQNVKLYTGAFIKPAGKFGFANNYANHLSLLENLMESNFAQKLASFEYMEDAFDYIQSFPGMGRFNSFQLLLDLSYSNIVNFSENDFVVAGPGAVAGLKRCFDLEGKTKRKAVSWAAVAPEVMRWMTETQSQHFARLALSFTPVDLATSRMMSLVDIEHTLCELDKYIRWTDKGHVLAGRKFNSGLADNLPELKLPKAWSHTSRLTTKIKPKETSLKINIKRKRYVIEYIVSERLVDGVAEYLIHWLGWPVGSRTWEPAENIREDAPQVVEDWLAAKPVTDPLEVKMTISQKQTRREAASEIIDLIRPWTASKNDSDKCLAINAHSDNLLAATTDAKEIVANDLDLNLLQWSTWSPCQRSPSQASQTNLSDISALFSTNDLVDICDNQHNDTCLSACICLRDEFLVNFGEKEQLDNVDIENYTKIDHQNIL